MTWLTRAHCSSVHGTCGLLVVISAPPSLDYLKFSFPRTQQDCDSMRPLDCFTQNEGVILDRSAFADGLFCPPRASAGWAERGHLLRIFSPPHLHDVHVVLGQ